MLSFSPRFSVLAILLATGRLAHGQAGTPPAPHLSTRADAWMDSVSRLPLPRQVAAVRARVLADTLLRHPYQYVCLMPLSATAREAYYRAQQPKAQAEAARPAGPLLLYMLDGYMLTDNYPAHTMAFLQKLDAKTIKRVTYLKGSQGAVFGSRGANGAILMETIPN